MYLLLLWWYSGALSTVSCLMAGLSLDEQPS